MQAIHLLIKPASSLCNLACTYCFYHDVSEKREVKTYGMMTLDTLEAVVKKTLERAESQCTFAFQGGEPTLIGLDFYRQLIAFEKKYKKPQTVIHHAIQTNGMMIDDEWAAFFAKNNFLVGLSLDGCERIHNKYRLNRKREGTYQRLLETVACFNANKVEYNILTVITKDIAQNIQEVYEDYKRQGFGYLQFIPCLDEIEEERGKHEHSLTPRDYEVFLKDLFDMWYQDLKEGHFVYVRYFENLVQLMLGYYPEACGMMGVCTHQNVVEADGSVYPCDFYVMDAYRLGNLRTESFEDLEEKRLEIGFIKESMQKDAGCLKCKWYRLCHGGCRRDRDAFDDGKMKRNYFCTAYKAFFKYAYPRLEEIAEAIAKNKRP